MPKKEKDIKKIAFSCPKCNKVIESSYISRIEFWFKLDMPYFICSDCKFAFISMYLLGKSISDLREEYNTTKMEPYIDFYNRIKKDLIGLIEKHYISKCGYRWVRFKKLE